MHIMLCRKAVSQAVPFPSHWRTAIPFVADVAKLLQAATVHASQKAENSSRTAAFRCTVVGSEVTSLSDPGEGLREFIEWLQRRPFASAGEDEPPSKKQRTDEECKICFDKSIDSVFTPCGHVLACFSCASSVKKCPICKRSTKAIKMYKA